MTVATGSGGGSTDTGSLMVTGSVNVNVLTFTKGDGSTFDLTVAASGSSPAGTVSSSQQIRDYDIFAVKSGSNDFIGNQSFSASAATSNVVNLIGSSKMTLGGITMLHNETAFFSMVEGDSMNQGGSLQFQVSNGGSTFLCNDAPSGSTQNVGNTAIAFENKTRSGSITFTNENNTGQIRLKNYTGSIELQAGGTISISGSLTRIQDVNFIPFSASLDSRILAITGSGGGGGGATLGANTFTGSQIILTGSSGPNNTFQLGTDDRNFKAEFNAFSITNPTQANVTFNAPDTYWLNAGSLYFQNFNSFDVGSGSVNFSLKNGGNYLTQVNGGGTIGFTTNTGSISLTTPGELNLQSNVLKLKSADASFTTQIVNASGSLMLIAAANTTASAHIAQASPANSVNLIFKPNGNTGATIVSGSSNIYTNPSTPTTGYTRYIGGSNNLYLNSSNGINSQITQSAASVSGNRPTMNNNIFNGTGNFSINQAPNTGTHTYSQNIIGGTGTTTINALGYTGSLSVSSNFNANGTITINAASASVAQIATGISGSGPVDVNQNIVNGGTLTISTPRVAGFGGSSHNNNIIAGATITITNISSSAAVNTNGNITNGNITYTNAAASAVHTGTGNVNNCQGAITVNAIGSAVGIANGLFLGGPTITNNSFSGSAGNGIMAFNRSLVQGQGHTISVTGSSAGTVSPNFSDNTILGRAVTVFSNCNGAGSYRDLNGCIIAGQNLIVSASNSFTLTEGGSGHFGRYNVNDGIRNKTGENVFSVGTGISGSRKTGFLIDSGSNTFVEGTLNVSGSSTFNGNTTITGSLILSSSNTVELYVIGVSEHTGSIKLAPASQLLFATGSNQQAGTAILDGANPGTVTVSNSLVTADSIIMLTKQTLNHTNGYVAVSAKSAGSFTITSNHNGDTDTVGWFIINNS